MIHRDLKPSNIFFAADGTVKVGDLGLVKDMMTDEEGHSWNNEGLQTANFVQQKHTDEIGTRLYMSPEQIALKPYNHKVDVYALAVILFELLVQFSTASERAKVIPELKLFRFPPTFKQVHGSQVVSLNKCSLNLNLLIVSILKKGTVVDGYALRLPGKTAGSQGNPSRYTKSACR